MPDNLLNQDSGEPKNTDANKKTEIKDSEKSDNTNSNGKFKKPVQRRYQKNKFRRPINRDTLQSQKTNITGNAEKTQIVKSRNVPERDQNNQIQKTSKSLNLDYTKIVPQGKLVSVVVPLYNEEESLMELSLKLRDVFDRMKCMYEVVFVDDGSNDGSFKQIKYIHSRNSRFHCIKFRRNYGKSAALQAGFSAAKGDYIITMDADLQDDPEEIPELINMLNSGYDLVSGWKKVRHDPFIKKHTSKFFNYITSKMSGIKLHDFNCGLKAYKKDLTKSVRIYGEMHRYIPVLAHLSGFKVTEKPVKHHARKYGVTKFGVSRFFNGFFDLLTVMFNTKFNTKPLHLFGLFGIISFIIGFLITAYLTVMKFAAGHYISERPLFFVGLLFIIVGTQFFSLGLIAEMITKNQMKDEEILVETTI